MVSSAQRSCERWVDSRSFSDARIRLTVEAGVLRAVHVLYIFHDRGVDVFDGEGPFRVI